MARSELLKDPQFKEIISEIRANAENIGREMHPNSPQMVEVRLQSEERDQRLAAQRRPVIVFKKPASLRKAA